MPIAALILAGGQARRMGGADKALLRLAGQPLIAHVLARLRPQVGTIALSANGDPERFSMFGLPVLPDTLTTQGPLAGILAGLEWAGTQGFDAIVTAPVDTPFLPADLVSRLCAASRGASHPAVAVSQGRLHPTVALWPVPMLPVLQTVLAAGERRLRMPLREAVPVVFAGARDPFKNLNTPDDLAEAETVLRAGQP